MMTPTARIEFSYEIMLSDGTKERGVSFSTQNGGWQAARLIETYGLKAPSQTTILNGKEHVYLLKNLPYNVARGEYSVVAYFNNPASYIDGKYPYTCPVVNVHLVFKRIIK